MTNKKFKKVSDSIQIQKALIVGTRNLMALYLALHQHGVSVNKVLYLDDKLLTEYVNKALGFVEKRGKRCVIGV